MTKFEPFQNTLLNNATHPLADISVSQYGHVLRNETSKHIEAKRFPRFTIHYIVKGKISFYYGKNQKKILTSGCAFLLDPETDDYFVSEQAPYGTEYYWVSFTGYNIHNYLSIVGFLKNSPFILNLSSNVNKHLKKSFQECEPDSPILDIAFKKNFLELLFIIANEQSTVNLNQPEKPRKNVFDYIPYICKITNDSISEPTLSIKTFAKKLNVHPNYLSRLFKQEMSVSYTSYITLKRIELATSLIRKGYTSVKEISLLVGYDDPLYFSKLYRKYSGISPAQDIQKTQANKNPTPTPVVNEHKTKKSET